MSASHCCRKQHISLVTIGHLDSGKSTLCGRLLFELGKITEKDLQKYGKECSTLNKMGQESHLFAYHLDKSKDERIRGCTINVGWKDFEATFKHYTLIDTPGHRNYINNTIKGISCGDVAILVVPANKDAFEISMAKGNHKRDELQGGTRHYCRLAHISGIEQMIVCINKMDVPSVNYSENRYNEIKSEVEKMLTKIGYKTKKIAFIPISALKGDNLKSISVNMPWYKGFTIKKMKEKITGYTLLDALEKGDRYIEVIKCPKRAYKKPFRMPIAKIYNINDDIIVIGRIEQGTIKCHQKVQLLMSGVETVVKSIQIHHKTVNEAYCGECVGINLSISHHDRDCVKTGDAMIINDYKYDPKPPKYVKSFIALVFVPRHPGKLYGAKLKRSRKKDGFGCNRGFTPIIHIRTAKAPCQLFEIKWKMGRSTNNQKVENPSYIEAGDQAQVVFKAKLAIVLSQYDECKPFGRLIIMDRNMLIMVGKIQSIIEATSWDQVRGSQDKKHGINTTNNKMRKSTEPSPIMSMQTDNQDETLVNELLEQLEKIKAGKDEADNECKKMEEAYAVITDEKNKLMQKNEENKAKLAQIQQTMLQLTKINKDLLKQQKEEKKEEVVVGFKNEILSLDKKMKQFGNMYDENKLSIMYENDAESVNVKQELEGLQCTNKCFGKRLQDISAYIESITVPNVMEYEKWDINMMILWIKTLDNGKYIKYCDVLREGFISDGIENGEALLTMDNQTDLRCAPFEIASFPDRKILIKHFQSLPTLKRQLIIMNNKGNDDNVDKEGGITQYI